MNSGLRLFSKFPKRQLSPLWQALIPMGMPPSDFVDTSPVADHAVGHAKSALLSATQRARWRKWIELIPLRLVISCPLHALRSRAGSSRQTRIRSNSFDGFLQPGQF